MQSDLKKKKHLEIFLLSTFLAVHNLQSLDTQGSGENGTSMIYTDIHSKEWVDAMTWIGAGACCAQAAETALWMQFSNSLERIRQRLLGMTGCGASVNLKAPELRAVVLASSWGWISQPKRRERWRPIILGGVFLTDSKANLLLKG